MGTHHPTCKVGGRKRGASMLEYVVMALAIGVLVTGGALIFGSSVSDGFKRIGGHVSVASTAAAPGARWASQPGATAPSPPLGQGNNDQGYQGTCAIATIAQVLRNHGIPMDERSLVNMLTEVENRTGHRLIQYCQGVGVVDYSVLPDALCIVDQQRSGGLGPQTMRPSWRVLVSASMSPITVATCSPVIPGRPSSE